MGEIVIKTEHLSKRYFRRRTHPRYFTLRDSISEFLKGHRGKERCDYFWALEDISFEVKRGSVIGVIGKNGAGKTTLLRILAGITEPTKGRAVVTGNVSSLLGIGTGFHPELTGRENIYLNGAILGMKRKEIDRKFDEVVAFAELEQFIDMPIKFYSSGMYVRLGFAVAAHLDSEVLLVDEILSVGDIGFQKKCLGLIDKLTHQNRTVVLISHNLSTILKLCREAILLDSGHIELRGSSSEVVNYYLNTSLRQSGEKIWQPQELAAIEGPFKPVALRLRNQSGTIVEHVFSHEPFTIEVEYGLSARVDQLRIAIYLFTFRGEFVLTSLDLDDPSRYEQWPSRGPGRYVSCCHIPANLFNEGRFILGFGAGVHNVISYCDYEHVLAFNVVYSGRSGSHWSEGRGGPLRPDLDWSIQHLT